MAERVWWCVLCVAEEVSTGSVCWHFSAPSNSHVRVLCHLIGFHGVSIEELLAAKYIDGPLTGVLLTRPHRQLAAWMNRSILRDDFHTVGNWRSDVFKRYELTEPPPGQTTLNSK